jgi:aspartate-semialdehyde dehydrogenase
LRPIHDGQVVLAPSRLDYQPCRASNECGAFGRNHQHLALLANTQHRRSLEIESEGVDSCRNGHGACNSSLNLACHILKAHVLAALNLSALDRAIGTALKPYFDLAFAVWKSHYWTLVSAHLYSHVAPSVNCWVTADCSLISGARCPDFAFGATRIACDSATLQYIRTRPSNLTVALLRHTLSVPRKLAVAVVGATGAVGREFLSLFEKREFPVGSLRLLASERSAGKRIPFGAGELQVEAATPASFAGIDVAFFSAGAARSKALAPAAMEAGAVVIDNSSAFRMNPGVPLCIPEINWSDVRPSDRLISVPNCSAIILLMAVAPLRALGQIERLIVSTYQSASGGGAAMMEELESQTRSFLEGGPIEPQVLPHQYAFNLFSHNTPVNEHGYNEEEWKVIQESRKILSMPDLKINVTCVRVPVLRAHSESVTIEFAGAAPSEAAIREALSSAPGVRVVDDRAGNHFPMPSEASGIDEVLVGRIRQDVSNPNAICLFVSGDQLLKGAALDGVQIAERLYAEGRLGQEELAQTG